MVEHLKAKKKKEKEDRKNRPQVKEMDYLYGQDKIKICDDVYNIMIAANMTNNCSPIQMKVTFKYSIMVFLI